MCQIKKKYWLVSNLRFYKLHSIFLVKDTIINGKKVNKRNISAYKI